ncbi:MAG: ABC transporter permease [Chloroflexi bacterium]|nr:ABC transporter permease [Chloroflexota bacterium]MCY4110661.1 ABC transporter permease [Chloroflexota bacterium]
MAGWLIRRTLFAFATLWAISMLSFVVIQIPPGDYVTSYIAQLQSQGTIFTDHEAQALRDLYGLDQPVILQYFRWLGLMAQGNFGVSFEFNRPVLDVIGDRFLLTIVVSVAALLLTWIVALPIGVYSAVKQYSIGDYAFTFIGFIGLAIPGFLLALVLMYFGFVLFDANVGGLFSPEYAQADWSWAKFWDLMQHMPIPALALGLAGTAFLIRIMRANLLDELRKPYLVTARAKGLTNSRAVLKYPVRVALNPFVSIVPFVLRDIVGGSVIVSIVLSLPTLGPILLKSLIAQDSFLAGTIILLLGVITVVGTLISDILLVILDPRIKFEARGG